MLTKVEVCLRLSEQTSILYGKKIRMFSDGLLVNNMNCVKVVKYN